MPTYNLKCTKCDYRWTDFMSISQFFEAKCPKCQAKAETDYEATQGTVLIQGKGFYQENTLR